MYDTHDERWPVIEANIAKSNFEGFRSLRYRTVQVPVPPRDRPRTWCAGSAGSPSDPRPGCHRHHPTPFLSDLIPHKLGGEYGRGGGERKGGEEKKRKIEDSYLRNSSDACLDRTYLVCQT